MRKYGISTFLAIFAVITFPSGGYAGAVLPPGPSNGAGQFNCNGSFCGNASSFWWDNMNLRLGIGTGSPAYPLDVVGTYGILGAIESTGTNPSEFMINDQAGGQVTQLCIADAGACKLNVGHDASNNLFFQDAVYSIYPFFVNTSNQTVTIGEGGSSYPLYIDNTARVVIGQNGPDGNLNSNVRVELHRGNSSGPICYGIDVPVNWTREAGSIAARKEPPGLPNP
jgi:hypothetical protein